MKDVLKLWIQDKIQLSIWLLCLSLLGSTWFLLPKSQCFLSIVEKPGPIMAQALISSLVLNIALLLSFIRFLYQNKDRPRVAKNKKDLSPLALQILERYGQEGNVKIPTQAFLNAFDLPFNKVQCAIDELVGFGLVDFPLYIINNHEETAYHLTSDGRKFLSKNRLL